MYAIVLFILTLFPEAFGIQFYRIDIDRALEKAKAEDKDIFIDTYAVWCKPCKQMDRIFAQQDVGDFFNEHFINVKVDMDGPLGEVMQKQYGVVWLPTMIILDKDGRVKNKIDKVVSATELLDVAMSAFKSKSHIAANHTLRRDPFPVKRDQPEEPQKIMTEDDAPILYVYDERASSGRPHIMYHEAYLHMQLMDGKQDAVVKKYLSTQDDWTTEKNIKFIFDFLSSTDSKTFDFFIRNKARFYEVIGKEKVEQSLQILIYQKLHNGYPRPTLDQSIQLFGYIDQFSAKEQAYKYFLARLIDEEKQDAFMNLAGPYLVTMNPYDHQVIKDYILYKVERKYTSQELDQYIQLMNTGAAVGTDDAYYHLMLANLYYLKSDKEMAMNQVEIATRLAREQGLELSKFDKMRYSIEAL